MKKLNIAYGGHQRSNDDLTHIQESITEGLLALVNGLTEDVNSTAINCVLSGCKITLVGTQGIIDIGAGTVILAGEICEFAGINNLDTQGASGQFVFSPLDTYNSNNPIVYAGGSQEYVHLNRKAEIIDIATTPANNQMPLNSLKYLIDILKIKLEPVDGWKQIYAQGSVNYPQFANGVINRVGYKTAYRKTLNGDYEFDGMIDLSNYTGSPFGILSVINFGALYPNTTTQGCATASLLANRMLPVACVIKNSDIQIGMPTGYSATTGDYVYMNGIRCYLK